MHNLIYLIGRLTKDPEKEVTKDGKTVTTITIAVNRNFKNPDGKYDADYIKCTLWNGIAESTSEYTRKGDLVGIRGKIQNNNYVDKNGNKKYGYEIIADKVSFLSTQKSNETNNEAETSIEV